ncbi:hypothetical protein [Paraliomyxa miuraensis]|uniref:hypothetical protein n=1 Tax=Paraliomyxa miuraensis TaxID=376150 RepID=UPI00225BEC6F|nr:hypothetical protein [Paraliomyxa miuraensis]MCX4242493.1 hypothetical protein [Paraliomyxa miuraensis]
MLRHRGLVLCSLGALVAAACARDRTPQPPTTATTRPASVLDHPFVYVGSGTRPGAIEPVVALDASRPRAPATMSCALWFGRDVTPKQRHPLEQRLPAALGGQITWGARFVLVTADAHLDQRLGEAGISALAEDLDAWVLAAHDLEPLVFAIREGVGASTDPDSWHRQSMHAVEDRVFPALHEWFAAHPPQTAGPQGRAVATIVRTLLRFVDAHQERWIRAYQDRRWFQLVDRSLGHDLAADIENTGAVLDADLPTADQRDLAYGTALQMALAARGRPGMGDGQSARLLVEVVRDHVLPDPWVGEAVGIMARAFATSRGPKAGATIAEVCLDVPTCPAATYADAVHWWMEAGHPDQARQALSKGEQRWPDHPAWAELGSRLQPLTKAAPAPEETPP